MKYETKITSVRKIADLIIGAFIMFFILWAAASFSPVVTAVILTVVIFRAIADTDELQLRADILRMSASKIDHKYGLKGTNWEQSIEVVLDEEEMERHGFLCLNEKKDK